MAIPRVLILRAPGTNCDVETQFAFEKAGAICDRIHIRRLREDPTLFERYQILVIPGGFSYGDDIAAGKILATELASFFQEQLMAFRDAEKLILGVCNGFQALLKSGLIVLPDQDDEALATLGFNDNGYQDRWINLKAEPGNCVFLKGLDQMLLPVAHGEGKFIARKEWILRGLESTGQLVLRYVDRQGGPALSFPMNPNGSQADVAGVCDPSGRVLGLMPHPERHVLPTQHPRWTREGLKDEGDGMGIFRNAVNYFMGG
jgi:phosphoribosylformylglycinamidine synthase subunit PurQ / glutaminase